MGVNFGHFGLKLFFSCLSQIGYRYRFLDGLIKMVAMATNNMNELAHRAFDSSLHSVYAEYGNFIFEFHSCV